MVSAKKEQLAEGKSKSKVASVSVKRSAKQKKPKDKPKRPLSAYNFFFKKEREKILKIVNAEDPYSPEVQKDKEADDYLDEEAVGRLKKEGGKVSFEEMGKIIGARWKNINPDHLTQFSELASADTERYKTEMQEYNVKQEEKMRNEANKPAPAPTPTAAATANTAAPAASAYGSVPGVNPYDMSAYASAMGSMYGYAADPSQYGAAAMGYGAPGMGLYGYDAASAFQGAYNPAGNAVYNSMLGGLGGAMGAYGAAAGAPGGMGAYGAPSADQYGQQQSQDQYNNNGAAGAPPPPGYQGYPGYQG
eukprot:CAMPEP_0113482064 /NCGR_PEP_ID=MMETSP0014_2-20120614/22728_1 /TAXON_ID=2857 /ORGANISM="Nitzschia sp." /LENGTH=304 /DNA_ID=CAMNT_0000375573 /DNA_START=609 /DNA_END=1523 /DNA_ORIENTATION=- /assembly_acc=CAM_ASM_000159